MKSREIVSCGFRSRCGCVTNSQSSNLTHESPCKLWTTSIQYTLIKRTNTNHTGPRKERKPEVGLAGFHRYFRASCPPIQGALST